MHSIIRQKDGTWAVARFELINGCAELHYLFENMPFSAAVNLCGALNGSGVGVASTFEQYAVIYG